MVGYTVVILSVINILKGLDILEPEKKWKNAYIVVVIALACIVVVLEFYTWGVVLRKKNSESAGKMSRGINGAHGNEVKAHTANC